MLIPGANLASVSMLSSGAIVCFELAFRVGCLRFLLSMFLAAITVYLC